MFGIVLLFMVLSFMKDSYPKKEDSIYFKIYYIIGVMCGVIMLFFEWVKPITEDISIFTFILFMICFSRASYYECRTEIKILQRKRNLEKSERQALNILKESYSDLKISWYGGIIFFIILIGIIISSE